MKKLITLLFLGWFVSFTAVGQVTLNVSPQTITADQGQNIDIDITTDNFTNIISFQFSLGWNDAILDLNTITTHGNLPGFSNGACCFGPSTITNSLTTSWTDPSLSPQDLPAGEVLFTLNFTVVGNPGTGTGLQFMDPIEISDGNFTIIQNVTTNDGTFTTNGGTSSGPLTTSAGSASDSTGKAICIPVSVDNFDLIEGFQYSINYDASVLSFDSVGAFNLSDLSTGNFNDAGGNIAVSWQDQTTGVGASVPNGTEIYKIYFTIIGAGGSSSAVAFSGSPTPIEISQGGDPNAPFNSNNGNVNVLGNGNAINGVTLNANNVTGDAGTQVCVDVTADNFSDILSFQYAMEFDPAILSFASVQFGNGNPLGMSQGGNFGTTNSGSGLLSVSWSDATNAGISLGNGTSIYEVCFDIIGSAGQVSPIEFNDNGTPIEIADINSPPFVNLNENNGQVTVTLNGTFDGLHLIYDCEDVAPGDNICVDVEVVSGFTDIVSMQYGFSWDPAVLSFTGIQQGNGNPLSLSTASFGLTNANSGVASVSWLDNTLNGVTLAPETSLYQVCFDVVGGIGTSSTLTIDDSNNTVQEVTGPNNTIINFLGESCTVNVVMNDPLVVDANNTTITDVLCNGESTGAIDITVAGGLAPYTFAWTGGNTTEDLSGIAAGTYTVMITDSDNETITETYTVGEPASALSVTGTATGETAPGVGGAIDITVAGGTAGYTFAWSNAQTTEDLSNLAAGTYTVTVTDANNCTVEESFTVDTYVCPTITVTGTASPETAPGVGGAVDISVAGGATPYTFAWSSGNTTEDLSNIGAGTYTVTVTDANNCTGTATFTVDVFGCPAITVTGTVTDEQSVGAGGAVDISVLGGTGNYTFLWSNSQTTEDLSNLIAGTYIVTATDDNNCTGTASFDVAAYVCPTITISGVVVDESIGGNNGSIDVTITPAGTYTYAWSSGNTTEDLSGIAGGTYTLTATDAAGCAETATFTVEGFSCPPMTIDFATTNVGCAGNNDGSITANVTGGTTPYTYAWQPVGVTTQTISGLMAGTYTLVVTDANDCTATNTVSITSPNAISISVTNTDDLSCQGANDGSITVNVSGGTAPLSVDWGSGMTGTTISNLAAGSYTPTVTDGNGCQQAGGAVTISEPAALSVTETITDATCNGLSDGAISLNISGGTGSYTVNWSNSTTGTSISGLPAGTISATISDGNGCSISEVYSVGQGQAISISQVVTNETVAGNDGAIDITVTPAGTYTYAWSNNAATEDIFGLTAGNYIVTVTDTNNGCTASASIPVTNSLGVQSSIVTDVTCNGDSDGSINITTYGGEPQYSWIWSNGASTEDLNNIPAGTYTLTITDATGLTSTSEYTIAQPTSISIVPTIQHEINFCDGSIDLAVTGGTGPYTFVWNTGQTSQTLVNLCDGNYTPTVTDVNGCTASIGPLVVNPAAPTVPSGNITVQNVGCNGGNDGQISLSVIGGDLPLTFKVTNLNGDIITNSTQNSHTFGVGGLGPDDYTVMVTDADGNMVTVGPITIIDPAPLEITSEILTPASAPGINDGMIDITPAGGTFPYTYIWNNGATSQDLFDIGPGTYEVTITDANQCLFVGGPYVITVQMSSSVSVTAINCFGEETGAIDYEVAGGFPPYTYVWTNSNNVIIGTTQDINNLPSDTYTVVVTDAMGNISGSTVPVLGPTAALEVSGIVNIPSATNGADGGVDLIPTGGTPDYTFEWENANGSFLTDNQNLTNVIGGNYFVTVTDNNGCTSTAMYVVPKATLALTFAQTDIACPTECNGVIDVTITTGTAPYTYLWDNGSTSKRVTDLCAGLYTVTATDINGVTVEQSFPVAEPAPIEVTIETSPGRAEAIVLGGSPGTSGYIYNWDGEASSNSFIEGAQGGIHVLQVTDSKGCQTEIFEFQVDYDTDCLRTRSVMSPNEDGKNDVFYINCIGDYSDHNLAIFNRWGQKIFESDSYDNTWAGTNSKGEDLPEGGYFFVLDYTDLNGGREQVKGAITIVRE